MWDEIYEKYTPELLRYAQAMCRNPSEAEDLTQEVFLRALQSGDTFEDLGRNQQRAWLYRTLKNAYCDRYRRNKLETQYVQSLPEDTVGPDPGIEQVETALMLQRLRPEDRTLFTLRYLEGYTASEISGMLHLPPGTVRSRLCRCRALLKNELK